MCNGSRFSTCDVCLKSILSKHAALEAERQERLETEYRRNQACRVRFAEEEIHNFVIDSSNDTQVTNSTARKFHFTRKLRKDIPELAFLVYSFNDRLLTDGLTSADSM